MSKLLTPILRTRFCFFNLNIEEVMIQENGVLYCQILLLLLCLLPGMQHSDSKPCIIQKFGLGNPEILPKGSKTPNN